MFEFDPAKSAANKVKHGIGFDEAQALWSDLRRVLLDARSSAEDRFLLTGSWNGKVWTAIFTVRGQNIRIISVRRARAKEASFYEQGQDN